MKGPPVMLASPTAGTPETVIADLESQGSWWFEAKFDGIRAVITRTTAGGVRITNRAQADITHRYPEVAADFAGRDFVGVLDGEMICTDERGRPDFTKIHKRDAQSTPATIRALAARMPATFVPFDVLEIAGKDVRTEPYTARRMRLGTLMAGSNSWNVSNQDGSAMWSVVQAWDLEGLVAKQGSSPYVPTRSKSWRKIKAVKRVSALVSGVSPASAGSGRAANIGALELVLFDPLAGKLVPIGKVGSGFSNGELIQIAVALEAGQFLVVEVEYLDARSGSLRMPVFKGIRTDLPIEACTVDQLS